jgi:hypothetical protein
MGGTHRLLPTYNGETQEHSADEGDQATTDAMSQVWADVKVDISCISIRSVLFVLKNNGLVTAAEFKELQRSWMRHKAKHSLDSYGRKEAKAVRPGRDIL